MLTLVRRAAILAAVALVAVACSSSAPATPAAETPSTTTTAAPPELPALRVGLVATSSGPNADRDSHAIEVLTSSANVFAKEREVVLEIVRVRAADDIERVVDQLTDAGVTVVFTTCDGALTSEIVDRAEAADLLAVTSCASLPSADLSARPRNVVDLGSLADHATVLADHLVDIGVEAPAFLRSTLVGDVERSCLDTERRMAATHGTPATASATFSGIVDGVEETVLANLDGVKSSDAIVLCALPGALADAIGTIRNSGFDQPIYIPWFASTEQFADDTENVFLLAPGSVFGDDPSAAINEVVSRLVGGTADASDALTADAFAGVINAVAATNSVGSRAIEQELLRQTQAATGLLSIDPNRRQPINRNYRVIEMAGSVGRVVDVTATAS